MMLAMAGTVNRVFPTANHPSFGVTGPYLAIELDLKSQGSLKGEGGVKRYQTQRGRGVSDDGPVKLGFDSETG